MVFLVRYFTIFYWSWFPQCTWTYCVDMLSVLTWFFILTRKNFFRRKNLLVCAQRNSFVEISSSCGVLDNFSFFKSFSMFLLQFFRFYCFFCLSSAFLVYMSPRIVFFHHQVCFSFFLSLILFFFSFLRVFLDDFWVHVIIFSWDIMLIIYFPWRLLFYIFPATS